VCFRRVLINNDNNTVRRCFSFIIHDDAGYTAILNYVITGARVRIIIIL